MEIACCAIFGYYRWAFPVWREWMKGMENGDWHDISSAFGGFHLIQNLLYNFSSLSSQTGWFTWNVGTPRWLVCYCSMFYSKCCYPWRWILTHTFFSRAQNRAHLLLVPTIPVTRGRSSLTKKGTIIWNCLNATWLSYSLGAFGAVSHDPGPLVNHLGRFPMSVS